MHQSSMVRSLTIVRAGSQEKMYSKFYEIKGMTDSAAAIQAEQDPEARPRSESQIERERVASVLEFDAYNSTMWQTKGRAASVEEAARVIWCVFNELNPPTPGPTCQTTLGDLEPVYLQRWIWFLGP